MILGNVRALRGHGQRRVGRGCPTSLGTVTLGVILEWFGYDLEMFLVTRQPSECTFQELSVGGVRDTSWEGVPLSGFGIV
jgi:hypothetical protein